MSRPMSFSVGNGKRKSPLWELVAGVVRIELTSRGSESLVLPLHHTPVLLTLYYSGIFLASVFDNSFVLIAIFLLYFKKYYVNILYYKKLGEIVMLLANEWQLALIIIAWVIFGFALIYLIAGLICAKKLMQPKKRTDEYLAVYESEQKGLDISRLDIPFEDIRLNSDFGGGYELRARLYLLEGSKKIVVCSHGFNSSSLSQLKYIHIWKQLGYSVLLPDNTTSGESKGNCITLGYRERYDTLKWLHYLKERFPGYDIGMYGESMGGAITIGAGAMFEDPLMFTIVYCTYASPKYLARYWLKGKNLPEFLATLFLPAVYFGAFVLFDVRLHDVSSLRDINRLPNPVLIMHSKGDRLVNVENGRLLKSERPDAVYHEFENSPHCRSWKYYTEDYEKTVIDFVKSAEEKYYKNKQQSQSEPVSEAVEGQEQ